MSNVYFNRRKANWGYSLRKKLGVRLVKAREKEVGVRYLKAKRKDIFHKPDQESKNSNRVA